MKKKRLLSVLRESSVDWLIPAAAVALVFVMLVPLPGFLLDVLFTISITASVLVLLSAIQILRPVQFSVFPSLLLLLTLFRLSLSLASTRRILLHGHEGPAAAGHVIEAFGQFVVGGNYIVGFVLFIALIAIQYLVVSHGAVRTAEVTARFTLDAMPGKQMAIDADLNAGLINEEQARKRREAIAREAEFCGAMDGAARFNQRDSLATVLITVINIVAGFLIGVIQQDMQLLDALKTYTILTVGDGLVALVPSLLVSVAGGLVVTRTATENTLGEDMGRQLFGGRKTFFIAAGVLFALALIPGIPKIPFLLLGAILVFGGRKLKEASTPEDQKMQAGEAAGDKPGAPGSAPLDPLDAVLKLDELTLEVGIGLVPLVDAKQGGQLLVRVKALRKHLAQQLGFLVPPIHITDNLGLKQNEYILYLRGVEIARWELQPGRLLAISSRADSTELPGEATREPAFNSAAKWISPELQAKAITAGYAVVDATSALATHISEIIKQNAHELLTRSETKRLIDRINDTHPKLIDELIPKLMTLGEVQKVLQQLLREQVSIRDLGSILESLVEAAGVTKAQVALVEAARHAVGRSLVRPLLDDGGELRVVTLDPTIEEECNRAAGLQGQAATGTLQISIARRVLESLQRMFGDQVAGAPPVLLCSSPGRFYLRRLLEPLLPKIVVVSPTEIPQLVPVQSLGVVR